MMEDELNGRMKAARDAMSMTYEELVTSAVKRSANDTFQQSIVTLEFARRASVAAQEAAEYAKANARYMLLSVIVLAVSAVITAAATIFSAWLATN